MEYTIRALAELAGVSTRTLRYYDQIGLLKPGRTTAAGYRLYGAAQVDRLQHILFERALGLSLAEIRAGLEDPAFDRGAALRDRLSALERERTRLDALILTIRKTIESQEGNSMMLDREKFECFKQDAIRENEARYGAEVRARYGDEVADRANARIAALTQAQYWAMTDLEEEIRARLEDAVRGGADPAGEAGRALAALHRTWLSHSWEERQYSPEAHRGLAALYVEDPRFTACYDREVPGCAAFLRDAILAHI